MSYHHDPVDYERRLRAKLTPQRMRSTLAFSGVYLMTYEMLKQMVLEKVREYFTTGCLDLGDSMIEEEQEQYRRHVLELAPKRPFRASLIWLVKMQAITQVQADRLDDVYAHRNLLAHELVKYIVDPDAEPDVDLLAEAVQTLRDIHRFWIDVEIGIGSFDHVGEVDLDDVRPLSLMTLEQCLIAYVDGLADIDVGEPGHDGTHEEGRTF